MILLALLHPPLYLLFSGSPHLLFGGPTSLIQKSIILLFKGCLLLFRWSLDSIPLHTSVPRKERKRWNIDGNLREGSLSETKLFEFTPTCTQKYRDNTSLPSQSYDLHPSSSQSVTLSDGNNFDLYLSAAVRKGDMTCTELFQILLELFQILLLWFFILLSFLLSFLCLLSLFLRGGKKPYTILSGRSHDKGDKCHEKG